MTGLKKNLPPSKEERRKMIEPKNKNISISRQCALLDVNRSSVYYQAKPKAKADIELLHALDEEYTRTPFYGSRRMCRVLAARAGRAINRKCVQRLMRILGIEAIYPRENTSLANAAHKKYPYLLRGFTASAVNQVWSTDITYVRLESGFVYLVAVIDWFSRRVLSWRLSNTLDSDFCIRALQDALRTGKPTIFNTDQGCQFTSDGFINVLKSNDIRISMDGKGRALDNIFVERLWRTVKYEDIYIKGYSTMSEVRVGLQQYFEFYNKTRIHQSLDYKTPEEVHFAKAA